MIMDFRAMLELEETPEILGKITESTETRTLTEIRDGRKTTDRCQGDKVQEIPRVLRDIREV